MKYKDGFENKWKNKRVETTEQIGRFSCFGLMIIISPKTYLGWWSDMAFNIYIIGNTILVAYRSYSVNKKEKHI